MNKRALIMSILLSVGSGLEFSTGNRTGAWINYLASALMLLCAILYSFLASRDR